MEDNSASDGEDSDAENLTIEEKWLQASRNGKEDIIVEMLQQRKNGDISLDVNCTGQQKSNRGWSALHLAAYFGHLNIVQLLLQEVVRALIDFNADVSIVNSEGQTPKSSTQSKEIKELLEAAENHESIRRHEDFLSSVRLGDVSNVQEMLKSTKMPNLNKTDQFGNTALHIAAQANQKEMAVLLLQSGVCATKKNYKEQTAVDFARTNEMKMILGVRPVTEFTRHPHRFEGILSKVVDTFIAQLKSRFMGFRPVWVVLERGVLSYFRNRGDASTGSKKKGMKYLDEASIFIPERSTKNEKDFVVHYSDGTTHTFRVDETDAPISRQRWINSLKEHISYSTHYTHSGAESMEDKDEVSIGNLRDALKTAQANQKLLERQASDLTTTVESLQSQDSVKQASTYPSILSKVDDVLTLSKDTCTSLSVCLNLFSQQDESRSLQLKEEMEKSRVLQEALHALATEHHELERSISTGGKKSPPRIYDTDDDEFYECADEDDNDIYFNGGDGKMIFLILSISKTRVTSHLRRYYLTSKLPVPMFDRNAFSVWTILKQCIGKELSKITMPVVFNEPLDFLQRIAEYMEYASLLRKACSCQDPVERLKFVSAFAVSAISSNWERIGKPFNPLLGATFELNRSELGFKYVAEQVSHHPPVSAFHVESQDFKFHGSIHPKLKFWGKSVEIHPKGNITLEFPKLGECYTWSNVNCCVHNVIVGKIWIESYGVMEIINHKTRHKAVLNFKQGGWFGKELHKVEGFIYNPNNEKCKALYGSWLQDMYAVEPDVYENFMSNSHSGHSTSHHSKTNGASSLSEDVPRKFSNYDLHIPGQEKVWEITPRPEFSEKYFSFTSFAMALNELTEDCAGKIPPTDARFRPDIRLLEQGNIEAAAAEKNRLEEKQRQARKDRKKKKEEWTPVWFSHEVNPVTREKDWIFKGDYWNREWEKCPDIF
ncbi:hypothetical protein FSP39_023560 [Pinctada imbricata]|uniref:Oxysterol-binding protein n=1 Tax=Pinctada imbricata TaxID=66713 RepID=A0AA89BP77_PINIB|nr:hypothetical protein FSP39_023560 [Pinctada imbricata]